jgi:primosomal protein N' (replication factor Y)
MTVNLRILKVAIPCPLRRHFDYLAPAEWSLELLQPGIRLRVPFGKSEKIGFLLKVDTQSDLPLNKLKKAIAVIDREPLLPSALFELCLRTADYYHHPIGDTFANALPGLVRQGKPVEPPALDLPASLKNQKATSSNSDLTRKIQLNNAQKQAIDAITGCLQEFKPFLLHGVTGSGKTEVYLRVIQQVIASGKQALVLVPEIGLTPQTLSRFQAIAPHRIAMTHSGLNTKERMTTWLQAKYQHVDIVIGTRSAIFTPLLNPGVIIVDEEHDISYKQQEGLRYSARDLALWRAKLEHIPVVLGSATPSLESLANALNERYQLLSLPERAGSALYPSFHILDLRNQSLQEGLAPSLLTAIEQHIAAQGQVLLFLNRRGFAPSLLCHACGQVFKCQRCDANLTYHQHPPHLQCHHCNANRPFPSHCAQCHSTNLIPVGIGTQRLERFLHSYFPTINIVRIDRDSTRRKGQLQALLQEIQDNTQQILIGTQMLAKGHHFPNVTLVAVLDADSGLFSADFRTTERMAQMLIQVAGRAGRAEKNGQVIIQTHAPEHPLLTKLIQQGYENFALAALAERQAAHLPPACHMALLRAEAVNKDSPIAFLQRCAHWLKQFQQIQVFGPVAAPMERRAGRYRMQLLMQAERREHLHAALNYLMAQIPNSKLQAKVRWSLDVDPLEMF